jgi:hypothetical protein
MKIKITTHKPKTPLWVLCAVLFVVGILPLAYADLALVGSAGLLLLGTSII